MTANPKGLEIEVFAIGGGGGGGSGTYGAGGGGAGGLQIYTDSTLSGTYAITIGAGGAPGQPGGQGGNTTFGSLVTAIGGGGGGGCSFPGTNGKGQNGGCGGGTVLTAGVSGFTLDPSNRSPGVGSQGGNGGLCPYRQSAPYGTSGGGVGESVGAGNAGGTADWFNTGGMFSGYGITYYGNKYGGGGGGLGSCKNATFTQQLDYGGLYGGGFGATPSSSDCTAGAYGTGGGGGGGSSSGAAGGSGVVIVSYLLDGDATATLNTTTTAGAFWSLGLGQTSGYAAKEIYVLGASGSWTVSGTFTTPAGLVGGENTVTFYYGYK